MGKIFFYILIGAVLLGGTGSGMAAEYPTRQVEIIVPFPPGGSLDAVFRIIQPFLASALGVPVVVTTKPGAGGALGADFAAKAKPDGYTLLAGDTSSLLVAPAVNRSITYKYQDFAPIYLLASDPILVSSLPDAPWKDLDTLVAYAKKNPGKLSYGSTGMGTTSYFSMELFKISYGLDIAPVHFQGTGPIRSAILGGHVNLAASTFSPMIPLIKAGKVVPLVTSASRRIPAFPQLPTLTERGFAETSMNLSMGLFAPGKCPPEVVERLMKAAEKMIQDPAMEMQLRKIDILPDYQTGEATRKMMDRQSQMISKVVEKAGVGK